MINARAWAMMRLSLMRLTIISFGAISSLAWAQEDPVENKVQCNTKVCSWIEEVFSSVSLPPDKRKDFPLITIENLIPALPPVQAIAYSKRGFVVSETGERTTAPCTLSLVLAAVPQSYQTMQSNRKVRALQVSLITDTGGRGFFLSDGVQHVSGVDLSTPATDSLRSAEPWQTIIRVNKTGTIRITQQEEQKPRTQQSQQEEFFRAFATLDIGQTKDTKNARFTITRSFEASSTVQTAFNNMGTELSTKTLSCEFE